MKYGPFPANWHVLSVNDSDYMPECMAITFHEDIDYRVMVLYAYWDDEDDSWKVWHDMGASFSAEELVKFIDCVNNAK